MNEPTENEFPCSDERIRILTDRLINTALRLHRQGMDTLADKVLDALKVEHMWNPDLVNSNIFEI